MTEREREALLAEAKAWWAIGRDIEQRGELALFWGNPIKYEQDVVVQEAMTCRAYAEQGNSIIGSDYGVEHGVARAYGAYWLALECEEEANA